jgi:hypothetical protein
MNSITTTSAKHQPKDRDSRIIQAAIVKILTAKPGTARLTIVANLSDAFNSSAIHAQMRAMLEAGEMIEQSEPRLGPRCYLKDQPRQIGQVLQIRSAAVTSYFDASISAPTPKPLAEVAHDRMRGDGPLLDQPRSRRRSGPTPDARREARLKLIAGKITARSQSIVNLEEQRSRIVQFGHARLKNAPNESVRQIYVDRLAADLRHIDKVLKSTRDELQRQIDLKALIEGGAS